MTGDVREDRRLTGEVRELIGGSDVDALLSRLPREDAHRGDERGVGRRDLRVIAEQHDAAAAGVEVQRVGADDAEAIGRLTGAHLAVCVVACPSPFVDATALVDHEVVRDVGPVAALDVELVDAADVCGGVGSHRRRRVMHDQLLDRSEGAIRRALRLVSAPAGPGDDDRRRDVDRSSLQEPRRGCGLAARVLAPVAPGVALSADGRRVEDATADEHDGAGTGSLKETTPVDMAVTQGAVRQSSVIAFAHGKDLAMVVGDNRLLASPRSRPTAE